MNEKPFNPLDRDNLGASVAEAMLERLVVPLGALPRFSGAGVYAIYYIGDFPLYAPVAAVNRDDQWRWPLYVGKAIPKGGRKTGGTGSGAEEKPLRERLQQHASSIRSAENIKLEDFYCRYLVVEDIWIPLGESLLIAKFSPIWNVLMDGFGNHGQGGGRDKQVRSRWDTIHPGRAAPKLLRVRDEPIEIIYSEIDTYLRGATPPPIRPRMILDHER